MAFGYEKEELNQLAEKLRGDLQCLCVNGCCATISIGLAYCGNDANINYKDIIIRADQALTKQKIPDATGYV